ncbi:MAG TPA: alpha/beta hydrolase [Candidatus Acidoferrales bacterium]|jgi:dienelactone hydrolase|nr:alpha/beta hydrolase [Candidatus Acidoferrales bacterium]
MKPFLPLAALLIWVTGCAHVDTRADLHRLIDHPRVPLAPQAGEWRATNDLAQIRFSFAADASDRVPGILFKSPDSTGRRPVVIALHGTGGNKEGMTPLCRKLVERGFIAVAIDGRYHGERKTGNGTEDYNAAIVKAWHGSGEHPLYYDTVWDVTRLIDYLETREDVDPARIGIIGISKGGVETYFAAAADPRIAVAVPCIGMQSFSWALKHNDWQGRIATVQSSFATVTKESGVTRPDSAFVKQFYDRVVPGIDTEFDGPQMMRLIAPRPLLIINGDKDNHTPLPGVQECIAAGDKAYATEHASDRFAVIIEKDSGHTVKPDAERAAIDWFVKWLKP